MNWDDAAIEGRRRGSRQRVLEEYAHWFAVGSGDDAAAATQDDNSMDPDSESESEDESKMQEEMRILIKVSLCLFHFIFWLVALWAVLVGTVGADLALFVALVGHHCRICQA